MKSCPELVRKHNFYMERLQLSGFHLWLGFDDIYVRCPGQSSWETLADDTHEGLSWAARVPVAGGQEFLRQPGQKLGLDDSETGLQLNKLVLTQLLERVGDHAVLFVPPRLAYGLQRASQDTTLPPHSIILDSCLMDKVKPVAIGEHRYIPETDIYCFDWTNANQGVLRQFIREPQLVFDGIYLPVLMTTKAYAAGRTEILSYYQGESGLGAATVTLKAPRQFPQGARSVGFGLVWAWGFGVRMWQWALKPVALPRGKMWQCEFIPPNICRISVEGGDKSGYEDEWTLLEPVMDVFDSIAD